MSRDRSYRLHSLLTAVGVVLFVVTACPPSGGPVLAGRPECPADSVLIPGDTAFGSKHELAAPGIITLVPEFHDCQRLITVGDSGFGPLVAVFATYKLDSLQQLYSSPRTATQVVPTGTGRASATLLNYDAPYEPLRIEHGFNCLYLTAIGAVWSAHIVAVTSDSACVRSMGSNPGGVDLNVTVLPGPGGDSIPPVARWDWDPIAHKQYIGIRCGNQWCEVFDPSQNKLNSSTRYDGSVQLAVKGWYDEQYLAVANVQAPTGLAAGTALGTLVPVEDLGRLGVADFDSTWRKVATVSVSIASPKYQEKFNLLPSKPASAASTVLLCKGNQTVCRVPPGSVQKSCDNDADQWWAQIVGGGNTQYHCVKRRTHENIDIPGMVRWRWQNDDDDMWIRCPSGCCHVN